jgi:hypothetical protein
MALDLDTFDGQDHSGDVVVYKVVVRFVVEQSAIGFNPQFTDADRERILSSPLRLNFKGTWPPPVHADYDRNLHLLAYTRLAAGMSVMNRSRPNTMAAELRQSVYTSQPTMDPAAHQNDAGLYASYKVSVAISERGEHVLTVRRGATGRALPHSDGTGSQPGREFDSLQKLVEADLLEKAAALAP